MSIGLNISNDIYSWAIARAGYSMPEFIKEFPNIEDWLSRKKEPTIKQLEIFSKKVHLPFGYLFLPEPPKEDLPFPFFRTNQGYTDSVSVNVYDTILAIQQRQEWLKEYLIEEGNEPLGFVGKFDFSTNYTIIVDDIRVALGLEEEWAKNYKTFQDALDGLTEHIEDIGIYTVFNGVVGNSTNRAIDVDECRGFVLVDDIAPFMFINNADSKSAQLFTVVHELAHIWLGQSAGFDYAELQPANIDIEKTCDLVAAEFLVPANNFIVQWQKTPNVSTLARYFKVSEIVIARRALDTGRMTKKEFFAFYNSYINREFIKKEERESGGNFYFTAKKRVGMTFAAHVNNAVKSGRLLYRDAYRLTGLKGETYQKFISQYF